MLNRLTLKLISHLVIIGHVADALQTTQPDVFVTSDGGYTWTKVRGPGKT